MPGPEESRTPYPLLAKQMLYQMSYRPFKRPSLVPQDSFPFARNHSQVHLKKWALMGSNHRPQRYQHCALAS